MDQDIRELCQQRLRINVRRLRNAQNLSQEALSARAGITRAYLGRIEARGQNVTLDTLDALASAFGIDPHELIKPPKP